MSGPKFRLGAAFGRELKRRLGDRTGGDLMAALRQEERDFENGLREPDQPSRAITDMRTHLAHSEFTQDERRKIRVALGIEPLADMTYAFGEEQQ